jgi:hypothetical protein
MIHLPKFASETEEADWWYENRAQRSGEFARAFAEGRVRRGGMAQYLGQLQKAKQLLSDKEDAVRLAKLAFRQGVDVQVYLNDLVHKAIMQEGDRAAS